MIVKWWNQAVTSPSVVVTVVLSLKIPFEKTTCGLPVATDI